MRLGAFLCRGQLRPHFGTKYACSPAFELNIFLISRSGKCVRLANALAKGVNLSVCPSFIQCVPSFLLTCSACLSFPESSASGDDDLIYAVKIPRESEAEDQLYPRRRTFLYGYVFFRQRKDASITRGYLQKSLVLLARRPCHSLYKHVCERIDKRDSIARSLTN